MSAPQPKSNLIYYVITLIAASLIVVYVFMRNFRAGEEAASVAPPPPEGTTSAAVVDEQALAKDNSLADKGKGLFQINCASCHGPEGLGNGPRAAGLTPPPRNYHTEKFKFGNDLVSIHNTIMKGSPGTSMPSFALLPLEDTWAIAHFVYTLIPNPSPTTDAQIASLPGGGSGGAPAAVSPPASSPASSATVSATPSDTTKKPAPASSTASATPSDTTKKPATASSAAPAKEQRIPIEVAMRQIANEGAIVPPLQKASTSTAPGAAIYAQHCASCHGAAGEGKVQRVIAVAPYRYESTGDLTISTAPWTKDRNKFAQIVVQGLPGRIMPGQATLTSAQIDDLYLFIRSLVRTR